MNELPTPKSEPTRPPGPRAPSGGAPAATPAPSSTLVDPVHHEFGDKIDEDAGEGHKGPRTDETKASSESRGIEAV